VVQGHRETFKNKIINQQSVMDTFFEFLSSDDEQIVNDIWEVLSNLPVNKSIKQKIKNLTISTEKEWY
jgi:CRISPR/Cas system endoribonuclease Cas6 (RAMP superfamily)